MTYKMFTQQPASWYLNPCMVSTVGDVRIRMDRSEKHLGLLSWDQWEYAWATEGGVGRRLGALDLLLTHCSSVALLSQGRLSWHTTHLTTCGLFSVLWKRCYLQALFLGRHTW